MRKNYGALAAVDKAAILDRIAAGEYVPAIAQSLGVSKQALAQSLAAYDQDAYLRAREVAAEIRLDEATMAIERAVIDEKGNRKEASDAQLDLACARERFRAVAWRAEREHPSRWGIRQQITHEVGPDLGDMIRDARKRVSTAQQTASNALHHGVTVDADAKRLE
jgi:hypothetical protein